MAQVRDLLTSTSLPLRVRQLPNKDFYVENLTQYAVSNYAALYAAMEMGTMNRTVAATMMNATSSRAHTIFQVKVEITAATHGMGPVTMQSLITLVDMAGSERAGATGATGDRLKEGAAINRVSAAAAAVVVVAWLLLVVLGP